MFKFISGGQTGTDIAGIDFAIFAGFDFGGTVPKGWRQIDKDKCEIDNSRYFSLYPGKFKESSTRYYLDRTKKNVIDSDITIIISENLYSPGTNQTRNLCKENNKPYIEIQPSLFYHNFYKLDEIYSIVKKYKVINIAGNSEYSSPGIYNKAKDILSKIFLSLD